MNNDYDTDDEMTLGSNTIFSEIKKTTTSHIDLACNKLESLKRIPVKTKYSFSGLIFIHLYVHICGYIKVFPRKIAK